MSPVGKPPRPGRKEAPPPRSRPAEERPSAEPSAPKRSEAPRKGGGGAPYGKGGGKRGKGGKGGGRGPPRDFDAVAETMPPEPLPILAPKERRMRVFRSARTDEAYGKAPEDRTVEELMRFGVIILDKTQGPTSHQVVAWVRDALGIEKIGHGGTLDPKVSGVLPTLLGEATKVVKPLQGVGKEYVAVMRLHGDAPEEKIRAEARRFIGKVRQVPPVRSAVARRQRVRRIYDLEVLQIDDRDVLLRVTCEGGTYIRNLCVDLGKAIGVRGHMAELRRTRTGLFHEEEAVSLHDLIDALQFWREDNDQAPIRSCILPYERAIAHLPRVVVRDSAVDAVCHGAELAAPGIVAMEEGIQKGDGVALYTLKGEALALGDAAMATGDAERAESGIVIKPTRVLLPAGTYPSVWKGRMAVGV